MYQQTQTLPQSVRMSQPQPMDGKGRKGEGQTTFYVMCAVIRQEDIVTMEDKLAAHAEHSSEEQWSQIIAFLTSAWWMESAG